MPSVALGSLRRLLIKSESHDELKRTAAAHTLDTAAHAIHPSIHPSRDEVNLFDASDALVSSAKWTNSEYGAALHLLPGGTRDSKYRQLPEKENVVKVLEEMGGYSIFVDALKVRHGTIGRLYT